LRAFVIGNLAAVPGTLFEIRYPDGDFEMDAFSQLPPPAVGQTIRRRGRLWKIVSRTEGRPVVVRVELADGRGPSARS
jgi:hypothetical protein